jgi:hypothetical protein
MGKGPNEQSGDKQRRAWLDLGLQGLTALSLSICLAKREDVRPQRKEKWINLNSAFYRIGREGHEVNQKGEHNIHCTVLESVIPLQAYHQLERTVQYCVVPYYEVVSVYMLCIFAFKFKKYENEPRTPRTLLLRNLARITELSSLVLSVYYISSKQTIVPNVTQSLTR